MKELIARLVEAIAPSGYENDVRNLIKKEIQEYSDDTHIDALGNLIVRKGCRTGKGKRVMLIAHMDEIGVIATHIDDNGFVRFSNLGVVRPYYSLGERVVFTNGLRGTIGHERMENRNHVPPFEKQYIDVGANNRLDCPIHVGDVAVFDQSFRDLGERMVSKSMDDRVGVAILINVLKKLQNTPNEIFYVFSVREEMGHSGAVTSAFGIDPEIGISIDVTSTGDTPKGLKMEIGLGKGPTIKISDSGMISDPRLVRVMINTAEESEIPHQLEVLGAGTTDAKSIQISRAGVPVSGISIPCRYVHSPSEMVDINDIRNAVTLLLALLRKPFEIQ